jgi:hypothetical protein
MKKDQDERKATQEKVDCIDQALESFYDDVDQTVVLAQGVQEFHGRLVALEEAPPVRMESNSNTFRDYEATIQRMIEAVVYSPEKAQREYAMTQRWITEAMERERPTVDAIQSRTFDILAADLNLSLETKVAEAHNNMMRMYKKIRDHLNVNVAAKVERLEIMAESVAELVESRENYQEAAKDLLQKFFTLNQGEIRNFDIGETDTLSPPSTQVTAAPTGQQLQVNHFGQNPPIPPQIQCDRDQRQDADGEDVCNSTPPPEHHSGEASNRDDHGTLGPTQAQCMNSQSNANVSEQVQQGNDGTSQGNGTGDQSNGNGTGDQSNLDRGAGDGGTNPGGNDRRSDRQDRDRHRRNKTRANHPFASGEVYGCFITVRGRPNIAWTVSEYERLTRNGYNLVKTYPTFVQAQLWLRRRQRRYKELNPGAPDADWSSSSEDDDSSGDGNGAPPSLGPAAQPPRAPPPPDQQPPDQPPNHRGTGTCQPTTGYGCW